MADAENPATKVGGGLNPKQRRFALEYLLDFNGKQAAIRAGYSPKCADVQASRLLRDARVRSLVEGRVQKLEEHTYLKVERLEQILHEMIEADPGAMVDPETGAPLPLKDIPPSVRRAVAGWDEECFFDGPSGEKFEAGKVRKVRWFNRVDALKLAMQRRKMLVQQVDVNLPGVVNVVVAGVRRGPT